MRDLCTNKVFTYLLAGAALAASGIRAQESVYDGAGFAYRSGDAKGLAAGLKVWINDRNALASAREKAWKIADEKHNWDIEKEKFLTLIAQILGPSN